MRKLSLANRIVAAARTKLAAVGTFVLGAGLAGPAAAQCTLVSGPSALTCSGCTQNMTFWPKSPMRIYQKGAGGPDRLLVQLNYGNAVFDLSNPASPAFIKLADIRASLPEGVGPISGDGQNFIAATGVSSDGQRALLSMAVSAHGGTNVGKPSPDAFWPIGSTGTYNSKNGLVVQKTAGNRYIAYGFATGYLWAADVTTLPSSWSIGDISSEQAFSGLTSGAGNLQFTEGNGFQYLYWTRGSSIEVADARNPGPSGAITAGYPTWTIPLGNWGRPSGDSLDFVSAAVNPQSANGNLYLLGAFHNSAGVGFSLLSFDPTTGISTQAGSFSPDPSFISKAGSAPVLASANPYSNDVDLYMWAANATSRGTLRLYTASARYFGGSNGPSFDLNANQLGMPSSIADMSTLRKSSTDVYAYVSDSFTPFAMQMSCQTGPAPAAGHLAVSNVSAGGAQLSNGATVFVGDTLRITPSVSPPNRITPIDQWNLDLNYHSLQETASGLLQLHYPDFTGCGDPSPSTFTLVGPCDDNFASGNPATGANCWTSVTPPSGNGKYGGPDFSATYPSPGTSATLPIAFEAKNSLNDTQSPPYLAQFNITWTVPAVKPAGLVLGAVSALLSTSNTATFQDASEGHPLPGGYKWYFGSNPGNPAFETLTQDVGCTGPSCTHAFPAGNGTYNAFLTASYDGGYSSPGCGPPCALPVAGSFIVNVTVLVAEFTASSPVYVSGAPISVTNQSQIGQGITPTYWYTLCDASSGPCPEGTYTQLPGAGPWTIPVPPTAGTWWLRMRATYGSGPTTAQWQPNVVSGNPDAWPIDVRELPPVLEPTGVAGVDGWNWCTVGCGSIAYLGTVGTPVTIAVLRGSVQQTGTYDWQISGGCASPGAATGTTTFLFTPIAAGTLTVSNTTFGISLKIQITGSLTVTAPSVVGAGSPDQVASAPDHVGSTYAWTLTNATITAGQGTSQVTFAAGTQGPISISVIETTAAGCRQSGNTSVTVLPAGPALQFYVVTPCRMLDTRSSSPIASGGTLTVTLTGTPCGIPSGAAAISANITVTQPAASGYLTIYPADGTQPVTSNISFKAGPSRANNAILSLSSDGTGRVNVFNGSAGTVHVILDVNGYFQ